MQQTIWAVLAGIIAQLGAALTDWKVAAVICAFITIILLVFIGRERIRKIIDQGL